MKKIISLLCALLIIAGANATPRKAGKAIIHPQQKEQILNAKKSKSKLSKTQKISTSQKGKVVQFAKARKAAETSDVQIFSYAGTFYPEDNTVFYGLHDEGYVNGFYFSIFLPEGSRDVELGKTYTLADMDSAYCSWDDEEWESHSFISASFTKTQGENYDVTIIATVVDVDSNTFNLTYKEEPVIVTGDTIEVAIANPMSNIDRISDGSWRLLGSDSAFTAQLNYFSDNEESPAGVFTVKDFDLGSIYIDVYSEELDEYGDPIYTTIHAKDGTISVSEVGDVIAAVAYILGDDGNVYHITMTYTKPHAETYETITADNLTIDDWSFEWWGELTLEASDANNFIRLYICPDSLDEGLTGTYTIGEYGCSGFVQPAEAEEGIQLYSGSFDVKYEEGSIFVTGKVLAVNNVEYTLDLSYIKKIYTATRQEELTLAELEFTNYGRAWMATGYSTDYTKYISLAAEYEELDGAYTFKDVLTDYSFIITDFAAIDDSTATYKSFTIVDANFSLVYDEAQKVAKITGTLLCVNDSDETDVPEFVLNLTAAEPDPYGYDNNTDFIYDFATFIVDTSYLSSDQMIYVIAQENNKSVGLEFNLASLEELVVGEYQIVSGYEPNTVSASKGLTSDGYVTYSFAGNMNAQGQISAVWFLVSGTVTIQEDEVIVVDALNSKGKVVRCRLGDKSALKTAEGTKANAIKRMINGQLIIERNGVQYNANGARVK